VAGITREVIEGLRLQPAGPMQAGSGEAIRNADHLARSTTAIGIADR
jgi:hypothetical protein